MISRLSKPCDLFLCLVLLVFSSTNAVGNTLTPKHSGVTIPAIETVVENLSVNVLLPPSWGLKSDQSQVVYQLEGFMEEKGKWINIFGSPGQPQAQTVVSLSKAKATRLDVIVPKFSTNVKMTKYRLLFGVNYGKKLAQYQNLGTVALNDGTYNNSGSLPGYTYVLSWAKDNQILPLTPKPGGHSALKSPKNPPYLSTYKDKKVLMVWDKASSTYQPFFVRGMDYEVTPVGQPWTSVQLPVVVPGETVYLADFNKKGGGQICKPLVTGPYGSSEQSYCFDTDLTGKMHSYLNNAALPGAAAPNALLPSLWERDFKMMQAMGVNMIRVYHVDALVRNMTEFLDMAYQYGIYVVMPAPAPNSDQTFANSDLTGQLQDWHQMTNGSNGQPWSALMQLALARYAAHPAILAWAVGNETEADHGDLPAAKVEWTLAKTIKDFNANLLVTATNQDHYSSSADIKKYYQVFEKYTQGTETYLDFYSINSYRGIAPNALQLGGMQTLFGYLDELKAPYDLPLLISEWGKNDNYDWGSFDNLWGYARMWRMILTTNSDILGLAYFEFSDEPVAKNLGGQHYMGVVAYALPDDYPANGDMVNDVIKPKFQKYAGVEIENTAKSTKKDKVYYQQYPAVSQAGVFDSFIGSNQNPLTKDPSIATVPNISYCAFSESPDPWSINSKCLQPEATVNPTGKYSVKISPAGGDSIANLELNGVAFHMQDHQDSSGVISFTVKGSNNNLGAVSIGFNQLGDKPAANTNTLLYHGFQGVPSVTWSNSNADLNIALPPLSSGN